MSIICSSCKRPAPPEKCARTIFLARPHDIFDLFSDQIEAETCPICGTEKSLKPTLLAVALSAHEIIYLDRGSGQELVTSLQKTLLPVLATLGRGPLTVVCVDDYQGFRQAVAKRLKTTGSEFPNFPITPETFVFEARHCQGEVFSAVAAAAAKAVPGFGVLFKDPDSGEELAFSDIVRLLQARSEETVFLLALSLTHFHQNRISVEEYLLRLVETSPFLGQVTDGVLQKVALAREKIEEADPKHDDLVVWFQIHALEASLHLFFNRPYRKEAEWAQAFLQLHIAAYFHPADAMDFAHLRLSDERVRKTIGLSAAFDATARVLATVLQRGIVQGDREFLDEWLDALEAASEAFCRRGLYGHVFLNGFAVETSSTEGNRDVSPTELADEIAEMGKKLSDERAITLIPIRIKTLSWNADPASLDAFVDSLAARIKEAPSATARLLKWFGQKMKDLGQPARSLHRMGRVAAEWEYSLPAAERRELWTERSTALRLVGARREALAVAKDVLTIAVASLNEKTEWQAADLSVAWLNVGILLRENGDAEEAITFLKSAVRIAPDYARLEPLESLGWTLLHTGRAELATACFGEARQILHSESGGVRYQALLIAEATAAFSNGDRSRAAALMEDVAAVSTISIRTLPQYTALIVAVSASTPIEERDVARAHELADRLTTERGRVAAEGNLLLVGGLLRSAAMLSALFQWDDEESLWREDARLSAVSGEPPHPVTAVELARFEVAHGRDRLLVALSLLRESLTWHYGSVSLDSETISALEFLDRRFDRLTDTIYELGYRPDMLQVVAALRRNAHSQAIRSKHLIEQVQPETSLPSPCDCCPVVAQGLDAFAVIEWIDVLNGAIGLVSTIAGDDVSVEYAEAPRDLPLYEIADLIGARLLGWRRGRKGEPFHVAAWPALVEWLRSIAESKLPGGGHLVVIDHARFSAIPFHIALAPRWTVSYAADWSAVVAAARVHLQRAPITDVGVAFTPRSNEAEASLTAFTKSVERTRELAETRRLPALIVTGAAADAGALETILSRVTISKILCHGQVSRTDADVGLLVSHNSALPPGYTFASTVKSVEAHRVGWREFSKFKSASPIVFFGACSSGRVQVLGLDERISIFSSLGKIGTRSVVAPRWKIDVESALPVLDDIIDGYVAGMPLSRAITTAAEAAMHRGVPMWQAFAFTVEGGWV